MQPEPWYRSSTAVVIASLLVPPLGVVLLWLRRTTEVPAKVFGTLAIAAVATLYVLLLFAPGTILRSPDWTPHYEELERHRAAQRETIQAEPESSPTSAGAKPSPTPQPTESFEARAPTVGYWTDFRGPNRDGRYDEVPIKTDWPAAGLRPMWRQPIGGGYASFVVAEGRAFTIEQRRQQEVVACYELETGRELWTHGWNAEFREAMGGDGPRATPTWNDGRVYALGATGELRCLEAKTGKLVWERNILADNQAENLDWGMAASPLVVDDKVIVLPGGRPGKSVVAYNKLSGKPIWRVLDDKQAYTSPMLVTLAGRQQLLVVSAERAMGLAVEDGALLWSYPWVTDFGVNSAQPIVVGENRVFISAGYGHGAALVEVVQTASGFVAREVWVNKSMKNKFNSSVLYEGHIYGLDDGILACVDVETGQRRWKGGRYGYGQLLLVSGHLIVTTDAGELVLVKAVPDQHTEVARFQAIEGRTWNNPAIAGGRLLVRNITEMACYDLRR